MLLVSITFLCHHVGDSVLSSGNRDIDHEVISDVREIVDEESLESLLDRARLTHLRLGDNLRFLLGRGGPLPGLIRVSRERAGRTVLNPVSASKT